MSAGLVRSRGRLVAGRLHASACLAGLRITIPAGRVAVFPPVRAGEVRCLRPETGPGRFAPGAVDAGIPFGVTLAGRGIRAARLSCYRSCPARVAARAAGPAISRPAGAEA
jgi:hypothetical protein